MRVVTGGGWRREGGADVAGAWREAWRADEREDDGS